MYESGISIIQLDLVSICNAKCPLCFRQNSVGLPHSTYPRAQHLDLELFCEALKSPQLSELQELLLCGNYGDAMASPHIVTFIDRAKDIKPDLKIILHTNGGLGSEKTWKELASRLNGRGSFVKFAIDGLRDTNHLYRRGVNWDTVMKNAQTFIEEGGRAVWKFVDFPHNHHQIAEAKSLSEKLGFVRFQVSTNFAPNSYPYPGEEEAQKMSRPKTPEEPGSMQPLGLNTLIDCYAKAEKSIFIDFDSSVWPCCWIAGLTYDDDSQLRQEHQKIVNQHSTAGKPFNSLQHFSLDKILEHPWFKAHLPQSLDSSITEGRRPAHFQCVKKCARFTA